MNKEMEALINDAKLREESFRELLAMQAQAFRTELTQQLDKLSTTIREIATMQQERFSNELREQMEVHSTMTCASCALLRSQRRSSVFSSRRSSADFSPPELSQHLSGISERGVTSNANPPGAVTSQQQLPKDPRKKERAVSLGGASEAQRLEMACHESVTRAQRMKQVRSSLISTASRSKERINSKWSHPIEGDVPKLGQPQSPERRRSSTQASLVAFVGSNSMSMREADDTSVNSACSSSGGNCSVRDLELSIASSWIEESLPKNRPIPGGLLSFRSLSFSSALSSIVPSAAVSHAPESIPEVWNSGGAFSPSTDTILEVGHDEDVITQDCSLRDLSFRQAEREVCNFDCAQAEKVKATLVDLVIYDNATRIAIFVLRLSGNLPWQYPSAGKSRFNWSSCYQASVVCIITVCLGVIAINAILNWTCVSSDVRRCRSGNLSDLALALGSLIGVLSVGMHCQRRNALNECIQHLEVYARAQSVQKNSSWLMYDFLALLAIFISAATIRLYHILAVPDRYECFLETEAALAFIVPAGSLLALTFSIQYLSRATNNLIDAYCQDVCRKHDLNEAVYNWSVLSAIMRMVAIKFERCFVIVHITVVSVVLLNVMDVVRSSPVHAKHKYDFIPGSLVAIGVARTFLASGSVTDRCSRVPSLINSITFGTQVDPDRHCVVEYIAQSSAGFYVFEVPITKVMGFKVMYIMGVTIFALAAGAFSGESG